MHEILPLNLLGSFICPGWFMRLSIENIGIAVAQTPREGNPQWDIPPQS